MNNTGNWYRILAVILISGFIVYVLDEKGVIDSPQRFYGLVIGAFSLWFIGYSVLSFQKGVYDFLGPHLTFTRFKKPILFILLLSGHIIGGIFLFWGALQLVF